LGSPRLECTVLTRRAFLKTAAIAMVAGAPMLQTCSRSATSQASPLPSSQPSPTPGLRAAGGALVDENGNEVCLTGVSWFGFETSTFAPHGLWARGWQDLLDQILASGFNLLRLPFCNQVLDERRMPNSIDYAKNPDLRNLTSLEVMDRIVEGAADPKGSQISNTEIGISGKRDSRLQATLAQTYRS
jgi:endoglucanase